MIEFEDAHETSIFSRKRGDRLPEWSPRLGHGFDQIVDWFCALDSVRQSDLFRTIFGSSQATFRALLVIGRRGHLDALAQARLRYRSQQVQVAGSPVTILTYDDLRDRLASRLRMIG